jgi:hypothetical protein
MDKPEYVYVASSWRCALQPAVVQVLKAAGIDCYDFRDSEGFSWKDVDIWTPCSSEAYFEAIGKERAERGFQRDMEALDRADLVVLVMPCGNSAHLELGYAVGKGKRTIILLDGGSLFEPDLMWKMADVITDNFMDLLKYVGVED